MTGHQPAGAQKLVLASLLLVLTLVVPLQAQEGGILEGQVMNGTPGGAPVGAEIGITLHILRNGSEIETRETTTDAEGRFRFEGLDRDPALDYWLEAVYQDARYSNGVPVQFSGEAEAITAAIDVYESSDDDSTLRLNSVHVIAESFGQVVRISEIHMFSNDGDRTFAGSGEGPSPETTVFIPLPSGAVGLAFSEEDPAGRYVEAEGGVWDTEPVTPGQDTSFVFLSYHLMVTGEPIKLERTFAYPVTDFNILVTQPGLSLQSEQLVDQGQQSFQDRNYFFYVAQDLPAGEALLLNFAVDAADNSAMPGTESATVPAATAAAGEGQQGLLRILGFLLAGLAIAAALAYPLVTRRERGEAHVRVSSDVAARPGPSPQRQRLIEELADLEDAHEEGRLDDVGYVQRRAQLYEALRSD
jgi:hypothetical protein